MKEVKFLTEKSQDKEKNLSFREQILRDLAEASGEIILLQKVKKISKLNL